MIGYPLPLVLLSFLSVRVAQPMAGWQQLRFVSFREAALDGQFGALAHWFQRQPAVLVALHSIVKIRRFKYFQFQRMN